MKTFKWRHWNNVVPFSLILSLSNSGVVTWTYLDVTCTYIQLLQRQNFGPVWVRYQLGMIVLQKVLGLNSHLQMGCNTELTTTEFCCIRPATLLKKRLWYRYFPVNFAKFLRTTFLQNTSGRLLLYHFYR